MSALEEELKMNKAALVDQRDAAFKHAQEIAAAMREAGSDREGLQAARKALEASQEEARQAKEMLSRRQVTISAPSVGSRKWEVGSRKQAGDDLGAFCGK